MPFLGIQENMGGLQVKEDCCCVVAQDGVLQKSTPILQIHFTIVSAPK